MMVKFGDVNAGMNGWVLCEYQVQYILEDYSNIILVCELQQYVVCGIIIVCILVVVII